MSGAAAPIGPARAFMLRLAHSEAGAMLFAFTAAMLVLRLGGNIVLTRLLDPHAFGVIGVIVSVMIVLAMLSDLGFLDFVIRHEKGNDRRFLDVIWTIRLGQSGLQTIAMLVCAWPIALFLGKPELALPIAAAAPLFLFSALCPMTLLLAQREGRIRTTCTIELAALAIQIVTNLALSLLMPDYRAVIAGFYASALSRPILTMMMIGGGSRPAWDRALAREFFGFSRWILASTLLTLLITQSDKFLFARLFSVADFGVYMLSVNLALALQPFGRNYVDRYFFPLIGRVARETPAALGEMFYGVRRRLYLVLFFGIGVGIGGAPALFGLLFDHRYEYGWVYLSVLLLGIAFDLDSYASIKTLIAKGRPNLSFRANLVRLAIFASSVLFLFGPLGPIAMPMSLAIAELGAMTYSMALLRSEGLLRVREHGLYYAALAGGAIGAAAVSLGLAARVVRAGWAAIG